MMMMIVMMIVMIIEESGSYVIQVGKRKFKRVVFG
jgi:hypothetical protein